MDFGIYKAAGFTSRQLVAQAVGSITPVMSDGIFSVIGAMKNNFEIPL